ncbi:origin recognition complex subunit Orc5 [Emericellopsis atlantica]|uniref:Origin recognition complex subunit Orc5 n=1 Tax=Emericellopsis atlantica TaxID=2614577 RepID=A0A9P7ZHG4_9HYPO|nr:origin recognition complex subunit Orc5 [Emericellopsis atlantica]KAG9251762.1 origin recognition complex subunit Orc5 [Emericellopsis atlantica]
MAASLFQLPDELLLAPVLQTYPCRDHQIHTLATLLYPSAAPCRTLTIHGVESTGKSAITASLLASLARPTPNLRYAFVNASQCITARHLFESIVMSIAEALDWPQEDTAIRCETLAQLDVELVRMLKYPKREDNFRFVLVLDAIDRARDAPSSMLPGLARLSEIIPCLTTAFILTAPLPLRTSSFTPSVHFPPYTKPDYLRILALTPPTEPTHNATMEETLALWPRFCAAVHDALVQSAARSLPSFKRACETLWPRFIAPIEKGTYEAKEFSKLLVAARTHFQDESVLNPSIISVAPSSKTTSTDLSTLLPRTARILLLCAYLASHNAPKHDLTLFSTHHQGGRRRRRVAPTIASNKHRKIARKLLGAHAFVLERMMAIYAAVKSEWTEDPRVAAVDADVGMAMATLTSLRLLTRVGTGDVMDRGGKWRISVGWEIIRGVGRSIGVELDEWLIE